MQIAPQPAEVWRWREEKPSPAALVVALLLYAADRLGRRLEHDGLTAHLRLDPLVGHLECDKLAPKEESDAKADDGSKESAREEPSRAEDVHEATRRADAPAEREEDRRERDEGAHRVEEHGEVCVDALAKALRVLVQALGSALNWRQVGIPPIHVLLHQHEAPAQRPVRPHPPRNGREDCVRHHDSQEF